MLQVINDIKLSLNNKTYLSALALVLTIPDICSQVENHVSEGNRKMYIDWFNNYVEHEDFRFPLEGFEKQTFDGNMCYALRCKVLHNGNLELKESAKSLKMQLDRFEFTTPESVDYYHGYKYKSVTNEDGTEETITILSVDYLCERICEAAEKFYNGWISKDDFKKYQIIFK